MGGGELAPISPPGSDSPAYSLRRDGSVKCSCHQLLSFADLLIQDIDFALVEFQDCKKDEKITGIGFIGFGTPAVLASGFSDLTLTDS